MKGVSVVICCHNSAARLNPTLSYLMNQENYDGIPWEVILVDNDSTDNTAEVARNLWSNGADAQLHVVSESRRGQMYARFKGLELAKYDLVSFVDDDNWVSQTWIRDVYCIMRDHPETGACGGSSEPIYEKEPPPWFEANASRFAIGRQGIEEGDITDLRGWLWGAGLTIRKAAWIEIQNNGLKSILKGRNGQHLASGDDIELCFFLRALDWRLYYSPKLLLKHFIPGKRMQWSYLIRFINQNGRTRLLLTIYKKIIRSKGNLGAWKPYSQWFGDLLGSVWQTRYHLHEWWVKGELRIQGNPDIINAMESWALFKELIMIGPKGYQSLHMEIKSNLRL